MAKTKSPAAPAAPLTVEQDRILISARANSYAADYGNRSIVNDGLRAAGLPIVTSSDATGTVTIAWDPEVAAAIRAFAESPITMVVRLYDAHRPEGWEPDFAQLQSNIKIQLETLIDPFLRVAGSGAGRSLWTRPAAADDPAVQGRELLETYGPYGDLPECVDPSHRAALVASIMAWCVTKRHCTSVEDALRRIGLGAYLPRNRAKVQVPAQAFYAWAPADAMLTVEIPTQRDGSLLTGDELDSYVREAVRTMSTGTRITEVTEVPAEAPAAVSAEA
jgi:hypothetical protein